MRIVIKDALNNQTVLCDGMARGPNISAGPVGGMPLDDTVEIQPGPALRAASIKHWNRGNREIARTLTVVREFESMQAAESWVLAHLRDCIRAGSIEFLETDSAGNRTLVTLIDAAIPKIGVTPMGVSRQIVYTLVGGSLQ